MKLDKLLEILLFGKNNEFMDNEKIEIKLQTRTEYYFDLIKKNVFKLGLIIVGLLIIAGTLYIGFYMELHPRWWDNLGETPNLLLHKECHEVLLYILHV